MAGLDLKGLGIHVKVSDIKKSREFYEGLGFKPVFGYGDEAFRATLPKECGSAPERYRGVTYKIAEGVNYEIADGHIAVQPDVFDQTITSPKVSAMVNVESLVPLFENANVKPTFPVRHYYWGTIEAVLRDPDGFVLVFITPYSEHEAKALSQLVKVEKVEPKAP